MPDHEGSFSPVLTPVLGYIALRRLIGVLGLFLPFVLWAGGAWLFGTRLQPTISDYHGTGMRDVFVGIMVSLAVFLFTYRGQDGLENWSTNVAGLFAAGVAWFPNEGGAKAVHYLCASLFFAILALVALFLFPRLQPGDRRTSGKLRRNGIYRFCGIAMLACIALILLRQPLADLGIPAMGYGNIVFFLEAGVVVFFGVAWLVKGEALRLPVLRSAFSYFTKEGVASPPPTLP